MVRKTASGTTIGNKDTLVHCSEQESGLLVDTKFKSSALHVNKGVTFRLSITVFTVNVFSKSIMENIANFHPKIFNFHNLSKIGRLMVCLRNDKPQ